MNKIVVLAAQTTRSLQYLRVFVDLEVQPYHIILLGPRNDEKYNNEINLKNGINNSQICKKIIQLCKYLGCTFSVLSSGSVNSLEVIHLLRDLNYDYLLYSGYGGQIVGKSVLEISGKIIHIHAGYLPKYRGSTTIFYSLLKERKVGVSAFLLTEKLDEGPILLKREYEIGGEPFKLTQDFDDMMRAKLLFELIAGLKNNEVFPKPRFQQGASLSYYVIHPLLKHLSILSVDQG